LVPRAGSDRLGASGRRPQLGGAAAADDGEWEVGRLTGRRGAPIVKVDVPVEIHEPGVANPVAQCRAGADRCRAIAGQQQRPAAIAQQPLDRIADGPDRRYHRRQRQDAGGRVALRAPDRRLYVADVPRRESLANARFA
jgi:hypothetical protein